MQSGNGKPELLFIQEWTSIAILPYVLCCKLSTCLPSISYMSATSESFTLQLSADVVQQ